MSSTLGRLAFAWTGADGTCTNHNASNQVTWNAFSYDAKGEVTDSYSADTVSYGIYHSTYTYFEDGTVKSVNALAELNGAFPTFTFTLDGEGRIDGISGGSTNPVSWTSYDAWDHATNVAYGSGDSSSFGYDQNSGRMTVYQASIGNPTKADSGTLTWNPNGSLGKLVISDALNLADTQTCNYTHDDLARIASANCVSIWSQTFTYDRYGNITKSGNAPFAPSYSTTTNQIATNSYDANGNTRADGFNTYLWSSYNQPTIINNGSQYALQIYYDALGRVAMRCTSSACTEVVYGPGSRKLALMNGQTVVSAFLDLPAGAEAVYTGSTLSHFRHPDWQGNARASSTPSQTLYYSTAYAPFGEVYAESGTADRSYAGHDQDAMAGNGVSASYLYDSPNRELAQYSRWISPDPLVGSLSDPQRFNRYAYVRNSPLMFTDPTGLDCHADDNSKHGYCVNLTFTEASPPVEVNAPGFPNLPAPDYSAGVSQGLPDSRSQDFSILEPPAGATQETTVVPGSLLPNGDRAAGALAQGVFNGPGMATLWNSANSWGQAAAVGTPLVILLPPTVAIAGPAIGSAATSAGAVTSSGVTNLAARGFGWYYALRGGSGVVLGKYPQYLNAAGQISANALNASPKVYKFFNTRGQWWTLDRAFLNGSIFRVQQFYLSNAPMGTGTYLMELQHLQDMGIDPYSLPWVIAP